MDVWLLRLLLDSSFFLAIFNPLISGESLFLRVGLLTVLAVWLVWISINWKKKDLAGRVQDVVFSEMKILAVAQIYMLVILGIQNWQEKCSNFVLLFAVIAILLLRAGRLVGGSQEKKRFWGANGVEIVAVLIVTVILSSEAVKNAAWNLLGLFYMKVILPILLFMISLIQLGLMLLSPLLSLIFSGVEWHEIEMQVEDAAVQNYLPAVEGEVERMDSFWSKMIGMAVVVVLLAIVFYFLYKTLSVQGSRKDRKIAGEVKKSALGTQEQSTGKRYSFFEEKTVRYYYRKFLNLCKKRDIVPDHSMVTSEMVQKNAVISWGEKDSVEELTSLYRDVRYGGKEDREPERKAAKALVKKIKSVAER